MVRAGRLVEEKKIDMAEMDDRSFDLGVFSWIQRNGERLLSLTHPIPFEHSCSLSPSRYVHVHAFGRCSVDEHPSLVVDLRYTEPFKRIASP